MPPYPQIPYEESRILGGPHPFKLACFGYSGKGGVTITTADGPPDGASWDEQVRITQLADELGIDAVLPGARWMGYGGPSDFQGLTYETFPWAAAMATLTRRCQVFATFHVPTAHPVRIAKTIATIDHIAGGRFGLNIVAGWNVDEIRSFGIDQREHDRRYDYADEFFAVTNLLMAAQDGKIDFDGEFFSLSQVESRPGPIQAPRPVYMAAGISPRGREFAARNADISFMALENREHAKDTIADTKRRAREDFGREIRVFGQAHIVCADTEREAQDVLHHYVDECGDYEAAGNLMASLFGQTINSQGEKRQFPPGFDPNPILRKFVASHGGEIVCGTPDQVVQQLVELSELGLDGTTITFLDYEAGLRTFGEKILPLMVQAGLRVDEQPLADAPAAAAAHVS